VFSDRLAGWQPDETDEVHVEGGRGATEEVDMTLPTFIVIGVAKGGTTSLYRYFDQHPDVFMYAEKGTNYFGYEDARDWKWADEGEPPLLRHFRVETFEEYEEAFAGSSGERAVGEVSPQYFRSPGAAARMHARLPDVQVIVSLRNPAERAFSGYLMRIRRGEPVTSASEDLSADSSHVREGFYYRRMKRYFDVFPREQIKVLLFDDFRRDPAQVMTELFSFIGVDPGFQPDTQPRHNPANVPRSRILNRFLYQPAVIRTAKAVLPERLHGSAKRVREVNLEEPPKMSPELRSRLLALYREDILSLEGLVQKDLSTTWLDA
jgi:Sulfotransferase family